MKYIRKYQTPEGFSDLILVSDGMYLTGLWFEGSEEDINGEERDLSVFEDTVRWLDIYFQGKEPDFTPSYRTDETGSFRTEVWKLLKEIPYGKT